MSADINQEIFAFLRRHSILLKYISLVEHGEAHPLDRSAGHREDDPDQKSFRNPEKRKSKLCSRIFYRRGSNRGRNSSGL